MKIKLNLIPPSKKEEIKKIKYLIFALRLGVKLGFVLLILAAALLSTEYVLKLNLASSGMKADHGTGGQIKEIKKHDAEVKEMNNQVAELDKLQNGQYYWSNFFIKLSQKVPTEIEITSLNTKNLSVFLSGKATTRENLVVFKQKIEQDECFEKINLPLSDLVVKNDVNFQIDFSLKEKCLKNEGNN